MNITELGKRIKARREAKRLTQSQIANSLMISAQAVSKWERGENAPDISLLKPLATLLDTSIDWILSAESSNPNTFEATVFCTSLRDFAKRSASHTSQDIAFQMNTFFQGLTDLVLRYEGVPIKYVGDGFLAYFSGAKHADRAIEAAQKAVSLMSDAQLLISLHTGDIYLGTIGHTEYSQPDIIGDTVNLAFLLNSWASQQTNTPLIISELTYKKSEQPPPATQHKKIQISKTHTLTVWETKTSKEKQK